MKHIPLPTDTPEQRSIVKGYTDSPNLEWTTCQDGLSGWINRVFYGKPFPEELLEEYDPTFKFRLSVPDRWLPESEQLRSPDRSGVSTGVDLPVPASASEAGLSGPLSKPSCICGFDSDGWRVAEDRLEGMIYSKGDKRFSLSACKFKTRRHLPDCPCVKKSPPGDEWNYQISPDEIIAAGWKFSEFQNNDWSSVHAGLIGMKPRHFAGTFKFKKPCVKKAPVTEIAAEGMSEKLPPVTLRNCIKCGQPHESHTFGPYDTVCPEVPIIDRPKKTSEETRFLILNSQIKNIIAEIDKLKYPQNAENQSHEADAQKSGGYGWKLDLSPQYAALDVIRKSPNSTEAFPVLLEIVENALRKIQSHANGGK